MKNIIIGILCWFPGFLFAGVDQVDWESLETSWRKPLCINESVYPIDYKQADSQSDEKVKSFKAFHKIKKIESLAYQKQAPAPEVLDDLKEIIVLKSLKAARAQGTSKRLLRDVKLFSKATYKVCTRILYSNPSTRCHDFLLITIQPKQFVSLVDQHFDEYSNSAIYTLDMKNQCRDPNNPDWNCSALAQDYFSKNHLQSCMARQLEPADKLEPLLGIIEEATRTN
jgi:hypothetical protein